MICRVNQVLFSCHLLVLWPEKYALCKGFLIRQYYTKVFSVIMFYFSGQALCGQCRDETHRAKMFSRHEVIHMSKKTKDNAKKVIWIYFLAFSSTTKFANLFLMAKKEIKMRRFFMVRTAANKKVFHNVKKPQDDD